MSYYGQGDYYMGAGDPFIGGLLKKVGGFVARTATSFLPGPIGAVARTAVRAVRGAGRQEPPGFPGLPEAPVYRKAAQGRTGTIEVPGMGVNGEKKRRRMNVANPKALRRAIRREAGFVKLARRALKGTGYAVVSKASRTRRHVVKESGPGSVTIQ